MAALARQTRHVSGDFFTPTFRITGGIGVGNSGLVGILNDATNSVMTFEDVYLSRIEEPGKIVAHYATAHMAKAAFAMAIVNKREDLGPAAVLRGGMTQVQQHKVLITTDTFEVNGVIEQAGRLDPNGLMAESGGAVVAVYDATITATARPEVEYQGVGVLINRARITVVCGDG